MSRRRLPAVPGAVPFGVDVGLGGHDAVPGGGAGDEGCPGGDAAGGVEDRQQVRGTPDAVYLVRDEGAGVRVAGDRAVAGLMGQETEVTWGVGDLRTQSGEGRRGLPGAVRL